jgi:hypothetical protein
VIGLIAAVEGRGIAVAVHVLEAHVSDAAASSIPVSRMGRLRINCSGRVEPKVRAKPNRKLGSRRGELSSPIDLGEWRRAVTPNQTNAPSSSASSPTHGHPVRFAGIGAGGLRPLGDDETGSRL